MQDSGTDPLSKLARDILKTNHAHAYERLVVHQTPPETYQLLNGITPAQLFSIPIFSHASAATILAALWLWHDGLEESHRTFQQSPEAPHSAALNLHSKPSKSPLNVLSVESVESHNLSLPQQLRKEEETLSFWHAIMHRREGDFGNAKYWYAKVTGHPLLASLGIQAGSVINPQPADKRLLRINYDGWNGSALVDLVQSVHESPSDPMHGVAIALQQLEWRVLFEHCAREAQM